MIEQIAKLLVDDPDAGSRCIRSRKMGKRSLNSSRPDDLGKAIGKQGRTVRALRNLVSAAGLRFNKRF